MYRSSIFRGSLYFILFTGFFFLFAYWITLEGSGRSAWRSGEKIALIRIEGMIVDSRSVVKEIRRYRFDPEIKAILVRIDSPGGAVAPSQEIYDELLKIRAAGEKKLVASMGAVAASGGYYIASAASVIVANPGTLTGSIGVIMELTNLEGLFQKIGIESITIKSGKNKDVGSPFRKIEKEERALLQNVLDDIHDQFIEAVASGRLLDVEVVRKFSDGRVFTGRQAKELGLIDELGNLETAIHLAAELAGIEGEPQIVETKERLPFFQLLKGQLPSGWRRFSSSSMSVQMYYLFTH
ncbi:MAG: signal peptide peptidase SppA [Nitrospiria bacterium]